MSIKLVDVDPRNPNHVAFLYSMLAQREAHINISHRALPYYTAHEAFVASKPYHAWWLIAPEGWDPSQPGPCPFIGNCYLTHQHEVGIFLLPAHRLHGTGGKVLAKIEEYARTKQWDYLLANIAPANQPSIDFFSNLDYGLVQKTYRKDLTHE